MRKSNHILNEIALSLHLPVLPLYLLSVNIGAIELKHTQMFAIRVKYLCRESQNKPYALLKPTWNRI